MTSPRDQAPDAELALAALVGARRTPGAPASAGAFWQPSTHLDASFGRQPRCRELVPRAQQMVDQQAVDAPPAPLHLPLLGRRAQVLQVLQPGAAPRQVVAFRLARGLQLRMAGMGIRGSLTGAATRVVRRCSGAQRRPSSHNTVRASITYNLSFEALQLLLILLEAGQCRLCRQGCLGAALRSRLKSPQDALQLRYGILAVSCDPFQALIGHADARGVQQRHRRVWVR